MWELNLEHQAYHTSKNVTHTTSGRVSSVQTSLIDYLMCYERISFKVYVIAKKNDKCAVIESPSNALNSKEL